MPQQRKIDLYGAIHGRGGYSSGLGRWQDAPGYPSSPPPPSPSTAVPDRLSEAVQRQRPELTARQKWDMTDAGRFNAARLNDNLLGLVKSPGTGANYVKSQQDKIVDTLRERLSGGELNQSAFDAGQDAIAKQLGGAQRRASDLTKGIRIGGKLGLQDIIRDARDDLRTPREEGDAAFDFDPYQKKLNEASQTYNTGLDKQLRNTFKGQSFFDQDKINEAVTRGYGTRNDPQQKLLAAVADQRRRASSNIGL